MQQHVWSAAQYEKSPHLLGAGGGGGGGGCGGDGGAGGPGGVGAAVIGYTGSRYIPQTPFLILVFLSIRMYPSIPQYVPQEFLTIQ